MNRFIISFLAKIYRHPLSVAAIGIIITVLFSAAIPFIKFDNDIKNFLSASHPHRVTNDRLDAVFGSSETILIGIESGNAYSKETLEYVRWLQAEIEKLNWGFPAQSISRELGLDRDEAAKLIEAINQREVLGRDALVELFKDPGRLSAAFFWDTDFAEKISRKVTAVSIDRVMELYRFPVDEIKSVLNTDYIRGEGEKFVVEKLIDVENINDGSIGVMKAKVKSWNVYDGLLFSGNDVLTAMSVRMNPIDINLRQKFNIELEEIVKNNPRKNLKVYLAGEPVATDRVSSSMGDDLKRLLPFVLLVMVVILFIIFRHYEGVVFPVIAMMISVVWTLGTMTLLGIPMSMVSITVPTVLTAVASAYGIHFMTHYFMSSEKGRYESSVDSIRVSGLAIVMAAVTTVVGFGSLVTSDMTHIKNYGIITAIGVFYSLIVSVTLIPAFLMLRRDDKPSLKFTGSGPGSADLSARILSFIELHFVKHPVPLLIAGLLIICASVFGMRATEVNMNTMDFFQEGSDIKNADERINALLSGTQILNLNIETKDGSDVVTPEILAKVDSFQRDVSLKFPIVGKTVSVNDFLKKMNQEMNGGKGDFYRLPETTQMAREYLLLYSGDLENVISKKMDKLRVHLSIKRSNIRDHQEIRDYAVAYFGSDFMTANNVTVTPSGFMDIMIEANLLVSKGQISSLLSSLIVVVILMYLIFRDLKMTIISMLPLLVGITMNFGIMGFLNIPLNAATALVASISIGMGIDYSIHFINQYRNSMEKSGNVDLAIHNTYEGTGRAILSNVASVMAGFLVLLFSKFPIVQQFGGLIAFTVTATGLSAILIIPAALKVQDYYENRKQQG